MRTKTTFGICCLLYIFLNPNFNFGQEKIIQGKVRNLNNDVSNVLVVNLRSKKSTITDATGVYTMEVTLRDTLRFTAVQFHPKEIEITASILFQNSLVVDLNENVIKLNEVTVTPYNLSGKIAFDLERLNLEPSVTSSTLGLPNADVEIMTQSERLLLEADRGKFLRVATIEDQGKVYEILGYLNPMLIINTHKIMNRVSGRTKSLKERVARDEDIELEKEILTTFSRQILSESFNIPENSIDAFLSYCLSQDDFSDVSQAANTVEVWEYLEARSIEFKKTENTNNNY